MTTQTFSVNQIAKYIDQNVHLTPNTNWTIWDGPSGLTHTTGSMEYRDKDHMRVMNFFTMDEAPDTMEDLYRSVEFQMKK